MRPKRGYMTEAITWFAILKLITHLFTTGVFIVNTVSPPCNILVSIMSPTFTGSTPAPVPVKIKSPWVKPTYFER